MNIIRKFGIFLIAICTLVSCVSSPARSFYDENIDSFSSKKLDNGIELIVKRNDINRVLSLKAVIMGGSALIPKGKAGLEAIGLSLLGHGSADYDYPKIQAELYKKSAAISSSAGYDYSTYSLHCIDKYFDELIAMYLDGFMAPSFSAEEFENVLNDAIQANEQRMADPDKYTRFLGSTAIFKGSNYESDPQGDSESLTNIKIDDVRDWYDKIIDADRIKIVAVGNFDIEGLFKKLNDTVGKLPRKGTPLPPVKTLSLNGPMIKETHEASEGVAYVQGYFKIPDRSSKDYVPFAIAMDMLDDLYFNIVREKYGACYSIGTIFRPAKMSYGILWVYQTTALDKIKSYIDEAVKLMKDDKLIVLKDPKSGEYFYATIEERLAAYKNKYVNTVYNQQKTNADVAESIIRSIVYFDDFSEYLKIVDKIKAVTGSEITGTFKTYMLDSAFRWVIVSDEAGLKKIDEAAYKGF